MPPLMVPLDGEARDGAEQVGLRAMAGQMLYCLIDEEPRLLARPFLAEQRHERRLPRMRVLAGALARGGFIGAKGGEIVGDLECEADVARIAVVWRPPLVRQLGHDARRLDGIFD